MNCTVGKQGKNEQDFFGLDANYFRKLAENLGWADSDWDFRCTQFDDMLEQVKNVIDPNSEIWGGFAGITISTERIQEGFKFSAATMNTGITILKWEQSNDWIFITVFTIELGITILGSTFLIAIIQYFLEDKAYVFEDYLWNAYSSIFFINNIELKNSSSRLVQISLWFMALILISTYTANMTAIMSVSVILNGIFNADNLNSKKVKTEEIYNLYLYNYGAKPVPPNNDTGITATGVVDDLQNQVVDAYVLDDTFAKTIEVGNCNIFTVARLFQPINFGILFPKVRDDTEIEAINKIIQKLNDEMPSSKRVDDWIYGRPQLYGYCEKQYQEDDNKIGVNDVYGLWIIMGSALVISWIIYLLRYSAIYEKVAEKLIKWHISDRNQEQEARKVGDELIVDNLKDVTNRLMSSLERELKQRLDTMDEKVTKFYELLLQDEKWDNDYNPNEFKLNEELSQQQPNNNINNNNNNNSNHNNRYRDEIEIKQPKKQTSGQDQQGSDDDDEDDDNGEQDYEDEPSPKKLIEMRKFKKNELD